MSTTKRTDLNNLVKKYQRFSVVNEIEQNILGINETKVKIESLTLSDLFSRENYDLNAYQTLEESLRKDGFFVPLLVVSKGNEYEIINGVKRFLLAEKIGLKQLPIVKVELEEERKFAYILENIQAEGDSALVKSYAFWVLKEKYHYEEEKLSALSSFSIGQVKNLLRLQNLPSFLKDGLKDFTLSYSEARSLLNLPIEKQKELYLKIKEKSFSVRDLEKEKRNYSGNGRKIQVRRKGKNIIIHFPREEDAIKNYDRALKVFSD